MRVGRGRARLGWAGGRPRPIIQEEGQKGNCRCKSGCGRVNCKGDAPAGAREKTAGEKRVKASVIIPNLNGAGWLGDSIESILAQDFADGFELIVIDNGSTDESLQIARSYLGRPGYRLIENSENTGFSAAVNAGIRASQAEYAVLFNNDAFAQPDWLRRLVEVADGDARIFSVGSLMLRYYEPELADDAGDYVNLFGWAAKTGDGLYARRYQRQRRCFSACGGAALYRKSILEQIGLFDEHFFAYYEDVDLGWRANSLGYKNIYCPRAVCRHICGATTSGVKGGRYNDFKSVQSGRNSLLLPYKNEPLLMLLLNLPFLLAGYLVKFAMFALRGFGKPYWQGTKEAFATFGKLEKPKFRFKNLPNYVLIQFWLIGGFFKYAAYRIRRAVGAK